MQDMILNYTTPLDYADADAVRAAAEGELWGAYTRALIDAGVFVSVNALHPAHTASTLRLRSEARDIQDVPYAASKQQFGGDYIIEAADLDVALHWASLNPAASSGAAEVRPVIMQGAARARRTRWNGWLACPGAGSSPSCRPAVAARPTAWTRCRARWFARSSSGHGRVSPAGFRAERDWPQSDKWAGRWQGNSVSLNLGKRGHDLGVR